MTRFRHSLKALASSFTTYPPRKAPTHTLTRKFTRTCENSLIHIFWFGYALHTFCRNSNVFPFLMTNSRGNWLSTILCLFCSNLFLGLTCFVDCIYSIVGLAILRFSRVWLKIRSFAIMLYFDYEHACLLLKFCICSMISCFLSPCFLRFVTYY